MSNKPAPRCPGCGGEMELIEVRMHTWRYSCEDCGWRAPAVHGSGKEGKDAAYDKAMQRYKPVYNDYQGATQSENSLHGCTVYGGGELNFDAPPGRYPLVCKCDRYGGDGDD